MVAHRRCISLKAIQIIEAKSAVDKERRLKMEFDTDSFDIMIDNCCSHTLTNDINEKIERLFIVRLLFYWGTQQTDRTT
jgi:hypothetical protein